MEGNLSGGSFGFGDTMASEHLMFVWKESYMDEIE